MLARRLIAVVVLCLVAGYGSAGWAAASGPQTGLRVEPLRIVTQGGKLHGFRVEIADNAISRERGLMFRKSVAPDAGMLFDFKRPQQVAFWMKNTLVPLDLLFVDDEGYIINLAPDAPRMSTAPIPSRGVVLGVLEIAGGRAAQLGIEPGDRVCARMFRDLGPKCRIVPPPSER